MKTIQSPLIWLPAGATFPPISQAWSSQTVAPGLLCAGGDLSLESLERAYRNAIFPWFSADQPILWWSPDPRMVLKVADFRLASSLRKTIKKFARSPNCEICVDRAFTDVLTACADSPRRAQAGSWIVPQMRQAYRAWHQAGKVHSVETWINGQLVGGLYFVAIGHAVFGESMFHRRSDASKIALAALLAQCRKFNVRQIDCQQNTRHLASLGAREVTRADFVEQLQQASALPELPWQFSAAHWDEILLT